MGRIFVGLAWMFAGIGAQVQAQEKLAVTPIFSDNMVLQHGRAVPVEGTAPPGANIHVQIDNEAAVSAIADSAGQWKTALPAHSPGSARKLTVTAQGLTSVTFANIAFGDVFLCSGQSNMEFTLRHATNADVYVAQSSNADLRLFNVPRQSSLTPQKQFASPVAWQVSAPDSARDFSAACYFMGKELHAKRKIPVGLIAASWGGSVIQDWMPAETLKALGGYETGLELLAIRGRDPAAADRLWGERLAAYMAKSTAVLASPQNADIGHFWEEWGDPQLAMFEGSGVYTASITLTAEQAKRARAIVVGRVDDIDLTRINGKTVGSTMGWDSVRKYELPAGVLRAGSNAIEIAALDTGGGGGMWGDEQRGIMLDDGSVIAADKGWQFRRGASLGDSGPPPYVPWIGGSGLTTLYNGMVAPIGSIPLAGIAWYQGEANVADAKGYAKLLPAMMAEWRKRFDTRPFVMAQLANFGPLQSNPIHSAWAELREAQRTVVDADAQAGMAVTIDIGDPYDIHPTNKKDVGHRLALAMEGKRNTALPHIARDGGQTKLHFDRPVRIIGSGGATGFEACDAAGACRFVAAQQSSEQDLIVEAQPGDRMLRYLWADSPIANLFDSDGVPVSPFQAVLP